MAITTTRPGRARGGVAGVRRRDRHAAVPLRAHARRGAQGARRRPGRADRQAARSTSAGSPSPPRSATCACASCARRTPQGTLPAILYMHGGGWVLGNAGTHDRLVRELAVGTGAAVVFVEYDRSPEAHYPVAIEQGYATAQWIVREGAANGLDPERMAVAGDSVGGSMTAALALMAQERGDVRFVHQSMYYPVTDAAMDTGSYEQFAEGYFLTAKAMAWFWDAYLPDLERRSEPYASPLRASDEQLAGLPPAFVIVDEADVLRDEGEAYAARLRAAGVAVTTVRYDGITHDFMMLNPLSSTSATRAAVAQAISILRDALHGA